jgi:poly-gamma-glutamate synthesis protein (capsule biosynthesis protein)
VLVVAAAAVVAIAASGLVVTTARGAHGSGAAAAGSASGAAAAGIDSTAPSSTPSAAATPAATPAGPSSEPLVPVVSFWSTATSVNRADIGALWAGRAGAAAKIGYQTLAVADSDADSLAAAFAAAHGSGVRLLSSVDVKAAVTASTTTIGLIPAEDVTPDVRALAVDGLSLFGNDRIRDVAKWPLMVESATPTTFSAAAEWTLAAGGDVNLSRQVYVAAVKKGLGPDYPWSAGNAVITGHEGGGFQGAPLALARNVGPAGAFRARFQNADLAIVNLEGSAPDTYVNDRDNLVFTFDPALLVGLKDAGIDAVSLANNHIGNGGDIGVVQTCQNLDAIGMAHAGAGANLTAARQPVWLAADGLKVALLGYSAVGQQNWASDSHPGAAPLNLDDVTADIRAAKTAGADIVIVMPHWGTEYTYNLSGYEKTDAAAFVAAGADLVLGSHSHWVGAIQSMAGPNGPAFIDYSMGDLLFNLNHDVPAQEGVIVSLSFSGKRLAQVNLEPTVMIDGARVGLLSPSGDGQAVLEAIRAASRKTSKW